MIYWLLFACRPDPGSPDLSGTDGVGTPTADTSTPPPWEGDPRYVLVDPIATIVRGEPGEASFGSLLAVGGDLDRDGVLEWSVGAPADSDKAVVRVYEGTEPVLERHPEDSSWHTNWPTAMAFAEVDGDGHKDLVFTFNRGAYGRVQAVQSKTSADGWFALQVPEREDGQSAVVMSVSDAGGGLLTFGWQADGSGVSLSPLGSGNPEDIDSPHIIPYADHDVVKVDIAQHEPGFSSVALVPVVTGGMDARLWFGILAQQGDSSFGELWRCPASLGLKVRSDCDLVDSEDRLGVLQVTGDLDSNGAYQVASSGENVRDDQGVVHVYGADGSQRATIRGTRTAQLGARMAIGTDADGVAWLLLGQHNWNGTEPAAVYAFRGTDVVGELTDEDAERVYVSEIGGRFPAFEVYRPTPDAEPQLLLGHTAAGAVYMVPFTPGEPTPSQ